MRESLRVLMVEDVPADAELNEMELGKAGFVVESRRVDTLDAVMPVLETDRPDLVLCDYRLPRASAPRVLSLLRERAPDLPVIVVTGSTDEETAVDCMKLGAWDYVLKERLTSLGPAVMRALELARLRTDRTRTSDELQRLQTAGRLGSYRLDLATGSWTGSSVLQELLGVTGLPATRTECWPPLVHPDDREPMSAYLADEVIGKRQAFDKECRIVRRSDGEQRWVHTLGQLVVARDGRVAQMIGTIQDITERRRGQEALRASEARFRLMVDSVVDCAIFLLDETGCVASWNGSAQRLQGYTDAEAIGLSLLQFFTPEDQASGLPDALIARAAEIGHAQSEGWRLRKDGTRYWAEMALTALRDDAGGIWGFADVTRDLTDRRRAEERTQQLLADLQRSNRDLEQFARAASHDLTEPLRAVAGCVELLRARYTARLDAQAEELITHAVTGAERMRQIIHDLLEYSCLGQRPAPLALVSSEQVLDRACSTLVEAIRDSGARISRDPLPEVAADAPQLERLFQNLLTNAIKFRGDRPPEVHVSARRIDVQRPSGNIPEAPGWEFSVRDNGHGIAARHQERIFGLFERLQPRRLYPGTGMGLAICRRIVERHGGNIRVASEPGVGSTFYFTLRDDPVPLESA